VRGGLARRETEENLFLLIPSRLVAAMSSSAAAPQLSHGAHRRRASDSVRQRENGGENDYQTNQLDVARKIRENNPHNNPNNNNNRSLASSNELLALFNHFNPIILAKKDKLNGLNNRLKKIEMKLKALTAWKLSELSQDNSNNYESNGCDYYIHADTKELTYSSQIKHYRLILQKTIARQFIKTMRLLKTIKTSHNSCHGTIRYISNKLENHHHSSSSNAGISNANPNSSTTSAAHSAIEIDSYNPVLYNNYIELLDSWDTESKHLRKLPHLHIAKLIHQLHSIIQPFQQTLNTNILKLKIIDRTADNSFKFNSKLIKEKLEKQKALELIQCDYDEILASYEEKRKEYDSLSQHYSVKQSEYNLILEKEKRLMQQITKRTEKQLKLYNNNEEIKEYNSIQANHNKLISPDQLLIDESFDSTEEVSSSQLLPPPPMHSYHSNINIKAAAAATAANNKEVKNHRTSKKRVQINTKANQSIPPNAHPVYAALHWGFATELVKH
jgi:hypothetical protein